MKKADVLKLIYTFLRGIGQDRWIVEIKLKRSVNSKRKGSSGELELAHKLNEYGYNCRRAQQYCGDAGDADVVGLDGVFIECKRVQNLNLHEAMDKAIEQSKSGVPVIFHRKDKTDWLATMTIDNWVKFYKEWIAWQERRENV